MKPDLTKKITLYGIEEVITILGIEEEIYKEMNVEELIKITLEFKDLAKRYDKHSIWLKGDYGVYVKGKIIAESENLYVVEEEK